MTPLGCTPYPHHSLVGVGQAAGDCELCVCASAGSLYSKLIKNSDRQVWVMWLKYPHEPLQGPNQVIDFSLIRADWNVSDEMDFCSLTDIKVKEQSVENMMRWAPITSSWLCMHVHTQALLSHDQRHAHSHTPDSVNLPVHDLHHSEGRRSTSLLDSWLLLRLQISWFKSSRGGGRRGQT